MAPPGRVVHKIPIRMDGYQYEDTHTHTVCKKSLAIATITGASLLGWVAPVAAQPVRNRPIDTVRTIHDPTSGEALVITNEGQCGKTAVEVRASSGVGFNDAGVVHSMDYSIDGNCNVTVTRGAATPQADATGLAPSPGLKEQETAVADGKTKTTGFASIAAIYGNVVHGSQTLQDIINIDIAKYRYGHDRVWDNAAYTYFKPIYGWMTASTSVAWNHPHTPVFDFFNSSWTYYAANGYGHADFHSDFLWCNLQTGQNFTLSTRLVSYWQGSYDANFSQSKTCSGTHMATRKWADLNQSA